MEERKVEALEQIADTLGGIHAALVSSSATQPRKSPY
jgi:hypothetical protein